jgi:hypothetical protein
MCVVGIGARTDSRLLVRHHEQRWSMNGVLGNVRAAMTQASPLTPAEQEVLLNSWEGGSLWELPWAVNRALRTDDLTARRAAEAALRRLISDGLVAVTRHRIVNMDVVGEEELVPDDELEAALTTEAGGWVMPELTDEIDRVYGLTTTRAGTDAFNTGAARDAKRYAFDDHWGVPEST